MPGSELKELTQEDVFHYIDEERTRNRVALYDDIPQKTKGGFKVILIINLISILIAAGGFFVVYTIFKQKEYQLVGSEKSIQGLEDVLYQELQKKANAELQNKQKEIQAIQDKLSTVNNQLADFKTKQKEILRGQMAKLEREYQKKIKLEQSNKTVKEKALIEQKYKTLMANRRKELEEATKTKEMEFQSRLDEERKKLQSAANSRNKELEETQKSLKKNQQELEQKLAEEHKKGQNALKSVQQKLEQKEKIEAFDAQVNTSFQSAIQAYQKKDYQTARSSLKSVLKLYENRPKGVILPSEKESVDKFFVTAINDYLSLKQNNAGSAKTQLATFNQALTKLSDFEKDVESGYLLSRPKDYQNRLTEISNLLPQTLEFSSAISVYKRKKKEQKAQTLLQQAETSYSSQQYAKASKLYLQGLDTLADSTVEHKILKKLKSIQPLMTSINTSSPDSNLLVFNQSEIDQKSFKLYQSAMLNYKKKNWSMAEKNFAFILTNYPTSSYAAKSFSTILKIREDQAKKYSLKQLQKFQTKKASTLYRKAEKFRKARQWAQAISYYKEILNKYAYATQGTKALDGLMKSLEQKVKNETESLFSDYSKNLNTLTNEMMFTFHKSNQTLINRYDNQQVQIKENFTRLTNQLLSGLLITNRTLIKTYKKQESELIKRYTKLTNDLIQKHNKELTVAKLSSDNKLIKLGRVIESVETDLIISPLSGINTKPGQIIKIFRKGSDNVPEFIATAKIQDASEYIITAKITEKSKTPKVGDLVYK